MTVTRMPPAHACDGCTRLFYPHEPIDGVPVLRCDAVMIGLSDAVVELAKSEGAARANRHFTKKRSDRFEPADRIANDQQAVGAELAVATMLGGGWTGGAEIDHADVGQYGVRWSRLDCMPIRISDKQFDQIMIFVTGVLPTFTIHGWIRVGEAKQHRAWYRADPPPYWCVPLNALHDLRRLPERRRALGIDNPPQPPQPPTQQAIYDDVPDDLD